MDNEKEFHTMEFVDFIRIPKVDDVVLHRHGYRPVCGTLCLTGHHMILSSRQTNSEELWLLHNNVDSLEKKFVGCTGQLTVKCKDFGIIRLDIVGMDECLKVAETIESLSSLEPVTLTYPFFYRSTFDELEDGWHAFLPENEFARLASDDWRISYVNKNFQICPSYPPAVIVPKSIDDDALVQSAAFRSGGRFPVLSYMHTAQKIEPKASRGVKTVILRSSQPLTGTNTKRCKDDERLLNAALSVGKRGYIIDTRSLNGAMAARTKGGGFETEVNYPQWRRVNKPLDKPSILQESLCKLLEACMDNGCSADKWISRLTNCGWLHHVKETLTTACLVAQCVDRENSAVLVHGSEGLDASLQVTSLAQVILDLDCRTVRGFEALIEREWIQAGHPFLSRCSKSVFSQSKNKYAGPVFLLFLDCVWQIFQQFPCSFEFNEKFLIMLFENAYASQFGTFLCNNENERRMARVSEKTVSLWTYINRPQILQTFFNPLYQPNQQVIWPSVAPQSLALWSSLYMRWTLSDTVTIIPTQVIRDIKQSDKELRLKVNELRRQLADLQKEALEKGLISD
nr:myotubularin-related protein 9-like isoform X2 [Lytechinus pictus]